MAHLPRSSVGHHSEPSNSARQHFDGHATTTPPAFEGRSGGSDEEANLARKNRGQLRPAEDQESVIRKSVYNLKLASMPPPPCPDLEQSSDGRPVPNGGCWRATCGVPTTESRSGTTRKM